MLVERVSEAVADAVRVSEPDTLAVTLSVGRMLGEREAERESVVDSEYDAVGDTEGDSERDQERDWLKVGEGEEETREMLLDTVALALGDAALVADGQLDRRSGCVNADVSTAEKTDAFEAE